VFPAENYTLIITENVMAQTLGWAAMIAGETSLLKSRVEGREMITNVSVIPLTADIRGENLLSWALGQNRLYLLSREGKVKHKLIDDVYAGLHEHIMPGPPSPQARLHYRDGLVFLFEPGETYRVMQDGATTSIELVERELGFALPEGFDIEDVPGEISFKTGGDPVSLVIAEVAASLEPPPLEAED
jgi:hypothetical protein